MRKECGDYGEKILGVTLKTAFALFSQVQTRLVMTHFLSVAGDIRVGQIVAGQVAHFLEGLLVFLPLVLASHLLTQVRH